MTTVETMDADIKRLTRSPKFHWFGYYDKLQFDPSDRYVLCMEGNFEGRSPAVDDSIRVGMIDLPGNESWDERRALISSIGRRRSMCFAAIRHDRSTRCQCFGTPVCILGCR